MAAFTNYLENELIKHIFRTGSFTKPTVLGIALFTAVAAGEAGTITEVLATNVTSTGYARVELNPDDDHWAAAGTSTDGTTHNDEAITFPEALLDWGTVTHFGIYDAASSGELLIYAQLTAPRTITAGSTPSFAIGALTVQVDN